MDVCSTIKEETTDTKYVTDEDIKLEQITEVMCSDINVKQENGAMPKNSDGTHGIVDFHNIKSDNIVKTEDATAVDTSCVFEVYEEVKFSPACSSSKDRLINENVYHMKSRTGVIPNKCS